MLYFCKKDLLNKWHHTILSSLEIAVILYLGVIIISTYFLQSIKYEPYREMLKSKGVRASLSIWLGSSYSDHDGMEQLISSLYKVKNIHYTVSQHVYVNGIEEMDFIINGYDSMMSDYNPDMSDGVWYTNYNGEYPLTAVVTENPYGIKTGDYVDIFYEEFGEPPKFASIYVCGVLRNGEKYINTNYYISPATIFDYYVEFNSEAYIYDLELPHFFMSLETMEELGIGSIDQDIYIQYDKDISEAEIKLNEEVLTDSGLITTFEELQANSLEEIMKKLMVIIPIALGALFFVTLSIACNSAIDTNKGLENYAILYILGMKWSSIIVMRLLNGVFSGALSLLIMCIISKVISLTPFGKDIIFEMGKSQWFYCIGIILYMILVSLIIPVVIINRNKPVSVFKEAKV